MPQVFAEWQAAYAAHGVPTFPVRFDLNEDGDVVKKPAVTGFLKTGLRRSAQLVLRFPDINALGFVCGASYARTKVTPLDVDTTDERVQADALNRHGPTPIIVRTASGKFHNWYKYNGERRRIRPIPGLPIDILGTGGFCIAPPSRGPTGTYEFIQGSLDDLDLLPIMRNVPEAAPHKTRATPGEQLVPHGSRNAELFNACRKAASAFATEADLIAFAVEWNVQNCQPPDSLDKVMDSANSVWKFETKRRTAVDRSQRAEALFIRSPDAAGLMHLLSARYRPGVTFELTNTYADVIGLGRERLARARAVLLDMGELAVVRSAYRGQPALYRRPTTVGG